MPDKTGEKLKQAFPTERVPKSLQDRMLRREAAVMTGRRAEEALHGGETKDADLLMAQAMLGRMARLTDLPKGAAPEQMVQSLLKSEGFRTYRKQSMEDQLRALNGSFMKELTPQKKAESRPEKSAHTPEKGRAL